MQIGCVTRSDIDIRVDHQYHSDSTGQISGDTTERPLRQQDSVVDSEIGCHLDHRYSSGATALPLADSRVSRFEWVIISTFKMKEVIEGIFKDIFFIKIQSLESRIEIAIGILQRFNQNFKLLLFRRRLTVFFLFLITQDVKNKPEYDEIWKKQFTLLEIKIEI